MINYFENKASVANEATDQEKSETVTLAAITRHWSTILNGAQIDKEAFKKEVDQVIANAKKMMESSGGKMLPEEMFK